MDISKKATTNTLTPEEQENLHLALQGNDTDLNPQPEQEPSTDGTSNSTFSGHCSFGIHFKNYPGTILSWK